MSSMYDKFEARFYVIGEDGKEYEIVPAIIEVDIGNTIDPSDFRSGRGESFSRYQILGREGIALNIENATISPDFAQWLEEDRKKNEHQDKLERMCHDKVTCETEGHNWSYYTVSTGYWGNDIEQAGICKRCGFDTHAHLEEDSI